MSTQGQDVQTTYFYLQREENCKVKAMHGSETPKALDDYRALIEWVIGEHHSTYITFSLPFLFLLPITSLTLTSLLTHHSYLDNTPHHSH
jgi:hypothetical protein